MKLNSVAPMQKSLPKEEKGDDEEYITTFSIRLHLEKFLNSKYGKGIEIISVVLSLFSSILFITSTYPEVPDIPWFYELDLVIMGVYIGEYSLRLFAAPHPFHFILTMNSFVDLCTIFPIILITDIYEKNDETTLESQLLNISRVIRIQRVIRHYNKRIKSSELEVSNVRKQLSKIIITLFTLIIISSGILLTFEQPERNTSIKKQKEDEQYICTCDSLNQVTFHEMIYFVVVTLATVGYGDIVPDSELGRITVIFLIVIVIVLIPTQTNELINLMKKQSKYARAFYKYNPEVPHIIICGQVEVSALNFFCQELYHKDHGGQDKHALILQNSEPSPQMEIFFHKPQFELYLKFLQGNPMEDSLLQRAAVKDSKACVVLTNKNIADSHSADHKNILTGLAIKKFVDYKTKGENNIRLCMQLIKPESKTHYYSALSQKSNDQLIIVEEFKMNLLAKSCFCPGIICLLGNLITSASEMEDEQMEDEWVKQYTNGMGHEIYRTHLSHKFEGKTFSHAAATIYQDYQGIMFAIELDVGGKTIIKLNPGSYVIQNTVENNVHVYIICEDKKVADQVATHEMNNEEQDQLKNMQNSRNKKQDSSFDKEYQQLKQELEGNDLNISNEEDDFHESDYILLKDPVGLWSVTPVSLKDSSEVTNHIVLCGIHPSIYYFILPLRARYLKEWQYIVILSETMPFEIWEQINRFPKIVYIKGSPLVSEHLIRANINFADKAVILGQELSDKKSNKQVGNVIADEMLDAESIFIYKAIKKLNQNVQIMIELVFPSNIEFLLPKDQNNENNNIMADLTPLYSAGEVYISTIIDTLTCQTYYNQHILTILQQILTGGKQSNPVIRALCEGVGLQQSNLWQIPVPEDFFNKTFKQLFNYLALQRNLIPLGLYRLPGSLDNTFAYTFTNPPKNTKLTHRDKVFVLAHEVPKDLLSGQFNEENLEDIQVQKPIAKFTKADLPKKGQEDKKLDNTNIQKSSINKGKQKLENIQDNLKIQKANIDLENLNINSATYLILDQVNKQIGKIRDELNSIKSNIDEQNDEILSKVKTALRQELATLTQFEN